jgi:hypothetical protein
MQGVTTKNLLLEAALHYVNDFGFAVFPCHSVLSDGQCSCGLAGCKSIGKHPRTKHGCKDASKDPAQINDFWMIWPDANVGIATGPISGIIVVDVDTGKGADLSELFVAGIDQRIFATKRAKTGAGTHYYYKYPTGSNITLSASQLAKNIDIRGDGGYVIAPPSNHVTGNSYSWISEKIEMLEFPQGWIDKLNAVKAARNAPAPSSPKAKPAATNGNGHSSPFVVPPPDPGLRVPQQIDHGARNNTLSQIAGKLRHFGLSENAIYSALVIENQRVCKPPLDDSELHDIAHSIGRYKPATTINPATDDDQSSNPDYENTLRPFLYRDFLTQKFEDKEILAYHIGRRDIAIIQAPTNAGKTTKLRNVTLCMTAGRPFMPFYDGRKPIKVAYFDFENDAQDVQRDLGIMDDVFTPAEAKLIGENLIVIPKGLMGGELFQFNTHEKWANELIRDNSVEFIIVDNISAAYDLNDENSNAEVTKKVIKPLLKMAYKCNCAFLFAHHYGKGKGNEIEHAGVHAGRGASALQALSRTVINMFGDVSQGEHITVECAKRKTDGGQKYREVFELRADRWFHHTKFAPPPIKQTAYQVIRNYLRTIQYPDLKETKEIIEQFENDYGPDSIKKALKELYTDGFIDKPKHGFYCGKGATAP